MLSNSFRCLPAPASALAGSLFLPAPPADYYIDCRTTTLLLKGGRLTGEAILDLLNENNIQAEAVAASPWEPIPSFPTSPRQRLRAISNPAAALIHGFLVRKAEKAHGTGRRIEGFCRPGARVVIVDDVCTTGASTIKRLTRPAKLA